MADKLHPRPSRAGSLDVTVTRRRIIFWVAVSLSIGLLFFVFSANSPSKHGATYSGSDGDRTGEKRDTSQCSLNVDGSSIPENSAFSVTARTESYEVATMPMCWGKACRDRNNRQAFTHCLSSEASEWNVLGVHAMERYVTGEVKDLYGYNKNSVHDAIRYFRKAIEVDISCTEVHVNLGLALMANGEWEQAHGQLEYALKAYEEAASADAARVNIFLGLVAELQAGTGSKANAIAYYDKARELEPKAEIEFWGIATTTSGRAELHNYGTYQQPQALADMLLYKVFAPISIARYALLDPGTQDWFVQNKYIVLRKIVPPFVLAAAQRCYRNLIRDGIMQFGDTQAQRYVAYNERCTRFLHYQLTDLVRTVVAHEARPSYTYFGGYKGGSILKPHTDRFQCEFTFSIQVEHYPPDKVWLLSLGKNPIIQNDPSRNGRGDEKLPPEDEIVDADLYAGDALLFMGRHLVHFRRGALPDGQWTNQAFLHYVQQDFAGKLD
jgi:tetratricopeptide (TPR) repeat protein